MGLNKKEKERLKRNDVLLSDTPFMCIIFLSIYIYILNKYTRYAILYQV